MTDKNDGLELNKVLSAIDEHFHEIPITAAPAAPSATPAPADETETEFFARFKESVFYGTPPPIWQIDADANSEFNRFELRPGAMIALGGIPGAGKTCFLGEVILKTMMIDQTLKTLFVNVEMSAFQLYERMLASQSRVPLGDIISRNRDDTNITMLKEGMDKLESIHERLRFMKPQFTVEAILANAKRFGANIVIVDYGQRIRLEKGIRGLTARDVINILMEQFRELAQSGVCVVAVSALSRDAAGNSGGGGKTHKSGMSAFRDSSEWEYACDTCWILDEPTQAEIDAGGASYNRVLRCHKNRSSEKQDIRLMFDGKYQTFTAVTELHPFENRAAGTAAADNNAEGEMEFL